MPISPRRAGTTLAAILTSVLLVTSLSRAGQSLRQDSAKGPEPQSASVQSRAALIVDDASMSNEASGDNWLAYGRTYSEQRFSPLTQINDTNIGRLGPSGSSSCPSDRGLVSTPLVVNGVLYFVGSMNVVRAVDARTGKLLWQYDPKVRARRRPTARRLGSQPRHRASGRARSTSATRDGRLWPSTRRPARRSGR